MAIIPFCKTMHLTALMLLESPAKIICQTDAQDIFMFVAPPSITNARFNPAPDK